MSRLRNAEGDYPWQTVRWSYGFAFFVGPCMIPGLQEGSLPVAAGGGLLGFSFVVAMALAAWKWTV